MVQNKDPLEVVREEVEVQVERFWGKETNLASIQLLHGAISQLIYSSSTLRSHTRQGTRDAMPVAFQSLARDDSVQTPWVPRQS